MIIILLGAGWLILAVLHAVGVRSTIAKKYRGTKAGRRFQKRLILSDCIIGAGYIVWGAAHLPVDKHNTLCFCIGILAITATAVVPALIFDRQCRKELASKTQES